MWQQCKDACCSDHLVIMIGLRAKGIGALKQGLERALFLDVFNDAVAAVPGHADTRV